MSAAPAYRVDGATVSADEFYGIACDPGRSVVVEACAGSGKTWMLVSRIVRALLAGTEPQHILAVTFTRKAAGEMRDRLDQWLRDWSAGSCGDEVRIAELRRRGVGAAQAQALAPVLGDLHEKLLRGGRGVQVRTFHAWFAQLLAHAPLMLRQRLGLPLEAESIEDASMLRDPLFRRFHRAVQGDDALRADYLGLVARHRRGVVLDWLASAWQRGPELLRADAIGHAESAVVPASALWPQCRGLDDPAQLLRRAPLSTALDELARALGAMGKAAPVKAATALRDALSAPDDDQAFELAWSALFTDKGEPRKQLGSDPRLHAAVVELLQLGAMRRQQRAHADHAAMLRLTRRLLSEYAALKRERGLIDMPDLERAAEALLGDPEVAGWVQERLDQQVRQVLIDEFQDTSPLQWQALHGWLQSYAGAGGGASGQRPPAVFIVGDPKQSIYRFRGAEPRVFEEARRFVVQGLAGIVTECDHTRRSAAAVVDVVNAVLGDARDVDGWGLFRDHSTASDAAGSVRRLPGALRSDRPAPPAGRDVWRDSLTEARAQPELRLRAVEAAQVASAVAALIEGQGVAPGDVMVLARRRSTLAEVAVALAAAQVPHVVAEALALHESPEALDLVALLDVIASPGHDLALARALKSPIFDADDSDLLWLARQAPARGWRDRLLGEMPPRPALQRARQLLSGWVAAAADLSPHDLLDRIVEEGEVLQRFAAAVPPARCAAAMHAVHAMLGAALDHEGGRFATLYGFVRELRAGRVEAVAAAPAGAVQLLTVHGAKGLEARAVVLVDADAESRPPGPGLVLVDWPVELAAPRAVAFVRGGASMPPSLDALWAREVAAREREELNGLYVALTRAREWFVLSRTEPHRRPPGRSWWQRCEGRLSEWVPGEAAAAAAGDRVAAPAPWRRVERSARPGAAVGDPDAGVADAAAARMGQALHRVLQWASGGSRDESIEVLGAAAALECQLMAGQSATVARRARAILDHPEVAPFFDDARLRWAGNEVTLGWQGRILRIDRLVALQDESASRRCVWWVLDYKLGSEPKANPAYREQLKRYVQAVQALQPDDVVRGAFVTTGGLLIEL